MSGLMYSETADPSESSERSPLIKKSDTTVYGTRSTTPDSESSLSSSDASSIVSKRSDEEAAIPPSATSNGSPAEPLSQIAVLQIILPMLLAVFICNADGSLVMATHPIIASEFMALESSAWLFTGFMLAASATQTTFGQLSEIYGRKPVILFCYGFFAVGCAIVGLANSMVVAILGRVLSGSVSSAGNVLVSLVITDLLPIKEVATWRSYVNVVAVSGRCVGGPIGGWLADVVGWRWSFLGQVPIFLISIIFVYLALPQNTRPKHAKSNSKKEAGTSKLRRVDFLGSALLASCLILVLLPLELGGVKIPWTNPRIPIFLGSGFVFLVLFVAAEKWLARNPLLPLDLFGNREVVASFLINGLQTSAQLGLMFCVPLYFQVTQQVTNTVAGAHLLPAVVGNAMGGILSGILIRKTGQYKWLIVMATLMSVGSYSLLMLRWHGHTNWFESLYIMPGGFGTGIVLSAAFTSVQALVDKSHLAPAISTLYLSQNIGGVVGLAAISATVQAGLRSSLEKRLLGLDLDADMRSKIIEKAVSSVNYIYQAKGDVATAVVASYVDGLRWSHGVSLIFSLTGFGLTFLLKERKL